MTFDSRLQDVFRSVFGDDSLTLTPTMTAKDIEGWDSVQHINLMFAIEQEFGFQFRGNELAEMADIGALQAYVAQRGR